MKYERRKMNFITELLVLFCWIQLANCASRDLYNTKTATSDLKWTAHPQVGGWEEVSVSSLDTVANTIRSLQVCNLEEDNEAADNWIRSPYIEAHNAKLVYLDIEYSMVKCDHCRETFTLYHYQSSSDVASSTFPPWKEHPYKKIDKVAAGNRFTMDSRGEGQINHKTFSIGPLRRKGLYLAAQDQGACMSMMSVRVYYYYCPETTHKLAYFPDTISGEEVASLIAVSGRCVSNAEYGSEVPRYRCNSNGEWRVPTGSCECRAGYQPNSALTACEACPVGFYKTSKGNHACTKCPLLSNSHAPGGTTCPCEVGYYRAKQDTVDQGCTRPPSAPRNVTAVVNKTTAVLSWKAPMHDGGRSDPHYSLTCQQCNEDFEDCWACKSAIRFNPADTAHIIQTNVVVQSLEMYAYYKVKIMAQNGVSATSKETPASDIVTFSTNDAVPSVVRNIVVLSKNDTSMTFVWSRPLRLSDSVTSYEFYAKILEAGSGQPRPAKYAPTVIKVASRNCTLTKLNPATYYEIKIRALSAAGAGQYSNPQVFPTAERIEMPTEAPSSDSIPIIAAVVGVLLIVIIIIIVVIYMRKKKNQKKEREERERLRAKMGGETDPLNQDLVVLLPPVYPASNSRTYVDYRDPHKGVKEQHAREIKSNYIKVEKIIGKGEFGEVCRGKLVEGKKETNVAIKRLKNGVGLLDQTNFLREACTMAQFQHNNIVQLKGVVTKTIPPMIISEFMENGSLDVFLQKNQGNYTLTDLLKMLRGIASGMQYLSQMQYVHRDLAARNILVSDDLTCKVSDFGLSRTFENDPRATYTTQGGKIPIRWTAPECFRCRQFTCASDVWSFGIVMWEVLSYGEKPYWDMTNEDVTESIEKGYRLPAPQNCPLVIHELMLECWSYEPAMRPTFNDILERLHRFINNPDMLADCGPPSNGSGSLVNPDSPNVFKFDDWLELMNLGNYKQKFQANGIGNLEQIAQITESDIERLGIAEPVLRERLQSGIETLRRYRSNPNSPTTLTLPPACNFTRDSPVTFSTGPRGGASASVV